METWLVILGMALITYILRYLPMASLGHVRLPDWFVTWLELIPVAVLAAMLGPTLITPQGKPDFSVSNVHLWAAIPTALVAWRTRSVTSTIIVGMAAAALLQYLT